MKNTVRAMAFAIAVGLAMWPDTEAQSQRPAAPSKAAPLIVAPKGPVEDREIARASFETPGNDDETATPLEPLGWMVGDWIDEDVDSRVETSVAWTKNRKFLRRLFRVTPREGAMHTGLQIIGWDPAEKAIRSWTYDADGGFGEETWRQSGDRWIIRSRYTLPDGDRATATNILKKLDDDRFTYRSVNRSIAGALQPDIDEVVVVRNNRDAGDIAPVDAVGAPADAEPGQPSPPFASEKPREEKQP